MAFRKKKAPADEGTDEFVQTLSATEEVPPPSDEGVTLSGEPAPEPLPEEPYPEELQPEPLPEPEPYPPEPFPPPAPEPEPEPEPEPDDGFAAEVQAHIQRQNNAWVLLEERFPRATKIRMEELASPSPRTGLVETRWRPRREAEIATIERAVDRLKPRKRSLGAGAWLKRTFRPASPKPQKGLTRIPANILDKRIVYETEGGFVVEVTYREAGEARKAYFTVSNEGGRTRALNSIQTGAYAQVTFVSDEKLKELGTPRHGAQLPVPPGKVSTFPITNRWDVSEIEGIGDVYARRLHELGVHTTDQLRLTNATVLANNLNTSVEHVASWQQMSELLCVKGIGKQWAEVLVRSGVTSVEALAKEKPESLAERVNKTIDGYKVRIVKTHLAPKRARTLIQAARSLKKTLQDFPVVEA